MVNSSSSFEKSPRARQRFGATTLAVSLALFGAVPTLSSQQDKHASLTSPAGRPSAPPFELVGEDGKKVHLKDYRGKVLLLNFWATECGGCVLEIPSFIDLEKAYGAMGYTTVGVAMDRSYEGLKDSEEAWARVRPFVAKKGINYAILMGDSALEKTYALNAYPATYLIDKSGRIAVAYKGIVIDKSSVESNIKQLLSER